jgi:predicted amidohydrolase YtcJ
MSTLYTNARFWSAGKEIFHDLLVKDSLILAVGEDVKNFTAEITIDLDDAFVIPAFLDGHAHPIFAGREAAGPRINGITSIEEIKVQVKAFADANPSITWIIGGAYEAAIIEGGDFDAKWLDEVVSDRPVVLHAVDHHTIWVNSKALELAGITRATKDPQGGTIARDSDGSAKGTLREPSAMALVLDHAPANTLESDITAIKYACKEYRKVGVIAAMDSWCEKDMARAYIAAARSNELAIAFNLSLLATPTTWIADIDDFNQIREECLELDKPSRLQANSIKFLLDGALSAGTAHLTQPYKDDPTSHGIAIWSDKELLNALVTYDGLQYQVHLHAIGDAAVKQALDSIEEMQKINPTWDRRPVIVHAQLIRDKDLPRFSQLGVIANIQPLWCYLDPMNKELIAPRIGHERNNLQYRLRSMLNAGAMIAFGSDWPVTSHVPWKAIDVPVTRANPAAGCNESWNIDQAITQEESWTFYSKNAAYQMFREKESGTLEAGKSADFIILRDNRVKSIYIAGNLEESDDL